MRSRRVAERCGFALEGHIRENKLNPDGTFSGSLYFGLLESEFGVQRSRVNVSAQSRLGPGARRAT